MVPLAGGTDLTGDIPTGIQVWSSSANDLLSMFSSQTQVNLTDCKEESLGGVTTVCTWGPTWGTWPGGGTVLVSGSGPLWTVSVRTRERKSSSTNPGTSLATGHNFISCHWRQFGFINIILHW